MLFIIVFWSSCFFLSSYSIEIDSDEKNPGGLSPSSLPTTWKSIPNSKFLKENREKEEEEQNEEEQKQKKEKGKEKEEEKKEGKERKERRILGIFFSNSRASFYYNGHLLTKKTYFLEVYLLFPLSLNLDIFISRFIL